MTSKEQRKNRGGLGARRYARARAQNERVQRAWTGRGRPPQISDERGRRNWFSVSCGRSSAVIEDDLITDLCLHGTCSADYPPSLTYTSRRTRTPPHLHFHRMV